MAWMIEPRRVLLLHELGARIKTGLSFLHVLVFALFTGYGNGAWVTAQLDDQFFKYFYMNQESGLQASDNLCTRRLFPPAASQP